MLKQELESRSIPYESIMDAAIMQEKGISHVPVLELPSGQLMMAAAALEFIKGDSHVR